MSLKALITIYSLIIAFAVFTLIMACMSAALNGFGRYTTAFSITCVAVSVVTCAWTSTLYDSSSPTFLPASLIWKLFRLAFRNRPTHILGKATTHVASFGPQSLVWLTLAIMMSTQTAQECQLDIYSDGSAYTWCALAATTTTLSFILFVLCTCAAFVALG
ncbi:hypothetical protein ONZ45_g7510 [Pleurotus djamor]|nr:hypothetical protein ONZ45_g7510 [Pleurotus djamor]